VPEAFLGREAAAPGRMAMEAYLKRHEAFIRGQLAATASGVDWAGLARFHRTQIEYLQHERLVHLLVMLFFGLSALLTLLFLLLHPHALVGVLLLLLLVLLVPYLVHYYRLENGVQRWYHLANEIEGRAGNVSQRYDDGSVAPDAR
jgi:cell division protein FtsW (lipid II flippase)